MPVPTAEFLVGMRQLAAGVTIVTSEWGGSRAGLTATTVCSVSADPPQLLVCVNRLVEAHDTIARSGRFAVNVLATGQRPLADRFAGRTGHHGDDRFRAGSWQTLVTGAPVLDGSCANLDCIVQQAVPIDTHTIYIGLVKAVRAAPDLLPMVYAEGEYGLVAPLVEAGQEA